MDKEVERLHHLSQDVQKLTQQKDNYVNLLQAANLKFRQKREEQNDYLLLISAGQKRDF